MENHNIHYKLSAPGTEEEMEKGTERNEVGGKRGRQTTEKNTWEKGNTNNGCRG